MQDTRQLPIYCGLIKLMKGILNMAIWQFDCMIVHPNRDISGCNDNDKYISWHGIKIPEESFEFLSRHLPIEKSWSYDIRQYGNRDSTCIEIYMLENDFDEIRCRFDLRNISMPLLENIIAFINMINGAVYINGKTIEANMQSIIKLVRDSDAARFCNNPIEFFKIMQPIKT